MDTKIFEEKLRQEVNSEINFREHPVNKDILGIYWGDIYTETSIPNNHINPERMESYVDNFGYPHRGSIEAQERVKGFIERFNSDPVFKNDVLGIEDEDTISE